MFYVRDEGCAIRPGFNFYPWSSKAQLGFVLAIGHYFVWLRYRKRLHSFFFKVEHHVA